MRLQKGNVFRFVYLHLKGDLMIRFFAKPWISSLTLGMAMLSYATAVSAAVQSPIDIRSSNTIYNPTLPALNFNYSQSASVEVHNTGSPGIESTIKGFVGQGAGSVTVGGVAYELLQFHFHTEAEHLVNGVRSAMEVHFVHKSAANELLVVGQLIEVGAFNPLLDRIFSDLPQNGSDTKTLNNFDLSGLLPNALTSFRYDGSLTTSPYTEGVKWNVLTVATTMSQAQIDAFRALFPDGDSREEQLFHGYVQTDLQGFSTVPEPTSLAIFGVGVLFVAFRNRRKLKTA